MIIKVKYNGQYMTEEEALSKMMEAKLLRRAERQKRRNDGSFARRAIKRGSVFISISAPTIQREGDDFYMPDKALDM